MSSPIKSEAFLISGTVETTCFHFFACVAKDCDLKSFKFCTVLLTTVLSLEIICIASSI